jgi:hypothetical protein
MLKIIIPLEFVHGFQINNATLISLVDESSWCFVMIKDVAIFGFKLGKATHVGNCWKCWNVVASPVSFGVKDIRHIMILNIPSAVENQKSVEQIDRQINRQTDRQTDRQIHRQMSRYTKDATTTKVA